ncbi:MAG: ribosome biogenesis GTPase YlqF [Lentisphaeria bacterium]|jgi:ribosome biogenesis GTPase A|nr:ribosome biogenesis GTPase YlqF [Lentisphaeria bacterium]
MTTFGFNDMSLTGWFPGHMLKAGRKMHEIAPLVDLVVELVDARLPLSSRNPRFRDFLPGKPAMVLANKADLADPAASRRWQRWFEAQGERVFFMDARQPDDPDRLVRYWERVAHEERERRGATLALTRPVRVMIAGIPNVGKSTLVNQLCTEKRAQVGPLPGVTRQNQWIRLRGDVELLDTPGVLWPQVRDKEHELRLALVGSIRDEVIGIELLAEFLWYELSRQPGRVDWSLYDLATCPEHPEELMAAVARRRGLLRAGGNIDPVRTAHALVKDYRDLRLGALTFEFPPEETTPCRPSASS